LQHTPATAHTARLVVSNDRVTRLLSNRQEHTGTNLHTPHLCWLQGLKLAKGARSRQEEEELVSRLLLQVSWVVW
jgi:hypothetical protein